MRIMRRVHRMMILLMLGLYLSYFIYNLDIYTVLKIPVLIIASYVAEFISVLVIMIFNLDDIISYKAFGADEYELQYYPVKLNQGDQIQR